MSRIKWQNATSVFLIGMGVGAGLGVLLAPKSGKETRDGIVGGVKNTVDGVVAQGTDAVRRAQKTLQNAKDQVSAAVEAGSQAYNESKITQS